MELVSGLSEIDNRPFEKADFLEWECRPDSVRGRLKTNILAWKELEPTEAVLSVIKEGYKLPLHSIPDSCVLRNNKSATQCISVVESQPWVVNPFTVSTRDDGKRRLVLDLRHVNPHLFKYKFKCEDITTALDLLGEGYYLYIKSAYHHVEIFQSH